MLRTTRYFLRSVWTWLKIFFTAKLVFLMINSTHFAKDLSSFPSMLWNGLGLDFSIIGYIMALPLISLFVMRVAPKAVKVAAKYYFIIVFASVAIILAADPFFFSYWGQKVNLSFLQFMSFEDGTLASIEVIDFFIFILFLFYLGYRYYEKWRHKFIPMEGSSIPGILFFMVICFYMIRGGTGKVPIAVSDAHFSENHMYNSTATNAVWQFVSVELEANKEADLSFFPVEEAEKRWDNRPLDTTFYQAVEVNNETNIIIIALESFVGKCSKLLGGSSPSYMPNLDALQPEAVWWQNAYAASFRSDKGMLALTHGIPSLGRQNLMNFPDLLAKKKNIFKTFNKRGYHTSFYYGGDANFAGMSILFNDANTMLDEDDFSSKLASSWGAHDEVVFQQFGDDFLKRSKPQLSMLFSISSHEPFRVPFHKYNKEYENSIAYADSCLGVLIQQLKNSPKWDNTLVFITADHGTILPDHSPSNEPSTFRIPMLCVGGAVKKPMIIKEFVSQTDLPATLNDLINEAEDYPFQSSMFRPSNRAFYSYYEGIGIVSHECNQQYDLYSKKALKKSCQNDLERVYYQLVNRSLFQP